MHSGLVIMGVSKETSFSLLKKRKKKKRSSKPELMATGLSSTEVLGRSKEGGGGVMEVL